MITIGRLARAIQRRVLGPQYKERALQKAVRRAFDPAFYRAQQPQGTVIDDPVAHFLDGGWRDGFDPSPTFSVQDYLSLNPDVADAGIDPFLHYLQYGKAERRSTAPSRKVGLLAVPEPATTANHEKDADEIAGAMAIPFYQAMSGMIFPDAAAAAKHYLGTGWRLGLDPHPHFSTNAYLRHYPDVAASGIAPFLHYVRSGKREGRLASDPADEVARILQDTPDLAALEASWSHGKKAKRRLSHADAVRRLHAALDTDATRLIVSLTHDDFRTVPGGVQFCVGQEANLAQARGIDYLALYPAQARPRLAPEDSATELQAVIGGKRIGPLRAEYVIEVISQIAETRQIDIVVHALLGHAPEDIVALAKAAGTERLSAWLHDFSFLCPSFALQRNLVSYCGAPDVSSTACALCLFGDARQSHLDRLRSMMLAVPVDAIAPSQAASDLIKTRSDLPFATISIVPHGVLQPDPDAPPPPVAAKDAPTIIAFAGTPARHKGYPIFRQLLRDNLGRDDLSFMIFCSDTHVEPGARVVPVAVTPEDPNAMVSALADEKVDFVLHWANWPETFSFSTFEAILAGTDVLTSPATGNVAAMVKATGRGHVLADIPALEAFLQPKALAAATAARRAERPAFSETRSALSFAVLDPHDAPDDAPDITKAARPPEPAVGRVVLGPNRAGDGSLP